MWRFDLGAGNELYDARARMWSPKLGTFLSVDEYDFHDPTSTLWGWPNQNPVGFSDPSGRLGEHNSSGTLLWWLRGIEGFNNFDMGVRTRAQGISLMSNDATAELGEQMAVCGTAQMIKGMGQAINTGAMIVAGVDIAVGAAKFGMWGGFSGGGGGGSAAGGEGARFNGDQAALIDLAKEGQRTGVTPGEANTLMQWAQEYGVSFRNDIGTTHWIRGDHIHIGPVNHIRVLP